MEQGIAANPLFDDRKSLVMAMLNRHVLVLNRNYEPMNVCSAKRAIVLIFLGKAEIVERYDHVVRSVSMSLPLPSVVRLFVYVHIRPKKIILSKRNIIRRDGHRCQYCGMVEGEMTVDHIIPKKFGGNDDWDNQVCACIRCNNLKGDRTPEQAGLRLLRQPRKPSHLMLIHQFIGIGDERWRPYLFLD